MSEQNEPTPPEFPSEAPSKPETQAALSPEAAARVARLNGQLAEARADALKRAAVKAALQDFVYQTTHLSTREEDGSHWCRIPADTLANARAALAGAGVTGEKAGMTQASESLANPSPPPPARPEGREELDVPPYIHEAADWLVRELHHREMMGIPHAMPLCVYAIPSWVGRVQKHVDALSALPRARETQSEDVDVRAEDGSGGPGQTQKGNET